MIQPCFVFSNDIGCQTCFEVFVLDEIDNMSNALSFENKSGIEYSHTLQREVSLTVRLAFVLSALDSVALTVDSLVWLTRRSAVQ